MRRLAVVLIVLGLPTLYAQAPSFKSTVQLVTVPLTVTNKDRDKLITSGLTAADFRVFEDGVSQQVTLLAQDRQPTSLCVVVDASGSMASTNRHALGVSALQRTVQGLNKEDEVSILRFASGTLTLMPWTHTPDPKRVSWKLEPDAGAVANSSIADAAKEALKMIDRASNPRRVILIISDGYENTSRIALSSVVKTRAQSEALVYAFAMVGPQERGAGSSLPLPNILPALVGDSGGVMLNIRTPADVDAAALTVLNELNYQYTLAYAPAKVLDGTYRRIKVEIALPGFLVRHRGGYLAVPSLPQ